MNQIKNGFSSIEQMTSQLWRRQFQNTTADTKEQKSFEQILLQKEQGKNAAETNTASELKFSRHANERLSKRSIDLSEEQVERLKAGAEKAQSKGIVESLVMVDEYAFIVNTRSNVVITAVDGSEDKVFTNIDGAVIS